MHHERIIKTLGGSILALALSACGAGGGGDGGNNGFQIQGPEIDLQPGQEITTCYYFRTPNTATLAIKRWRSSMTPGVHDMTMFTTTDDVMPPGTVSATDCGGSGGVGVPAWTYAADTPEAELTLPGDDGAGRPLGMEVPANQAAYFRMHFLNSGAEPIKARVTLNAEARAANVAYTRTAAYVTFNGAIDIPPNAVGEVESQTCTTPVGAKFWWMSTHAHKQAVQTTVKDGLPTSTDIVFASTDWEHPGAAVFAAPVFHSFATNKLTYECTYNNNGANANRTIQTGDSALDDEQCMAVGYYFPATKSLLCFNSTVVN